MSINQIWGPTLYFILAGIAMISSCASEPDTLEDRLEAHVQFLSDDALMGRETGTPGEQMAREYIRNQFQKIGLDPAGTDDWLQPFEFFAKKEPSAESWFSLGETHLELDEECYPLSLSGNGEASPSEVTIHRITHDPTDPHKSFGDLVDVRLLSDSAIAAGSLALVMWTDDPLVESPAKNWRRTVTEVQIPVFWLAQNPMGSDIALNFQWQKDMRTGFNVAGKIDNNASQTVVIGAHYDHLGWGEFGSLHNGEPEIHNGADDNASGVAGLIELARSLKTNPIKGNNYTFVAFSGEELGLFGSKNYVRSEVFEPGSVNYMLNMDMIGRLDSVSRKLAIDGAKTSPQFSVIDSLKTNMLLQPGGSGLGSSDHMSFYLEDIPSLHFFTGTHGDYHKPSDDEWLINYEGMASVVDCMLQLIAELDDDGKIAFNKVADSQEAVPDFKVTLGVIPDYMFDGKGMRIESVREDRPAYKAGLQDGDVVVRLGDREIFDMMSYMKALGAFNKGETVEVEVIRNDIPVVGVLTF